MSPSTPWWRLKLKLCSLHLKLNKWWQSNLGYTLVVSFGGVSISFEWVESCIKWKSRFRAKLDLEIFCQKTRQNEGRSAVRSWNVNKLSQFFHYFAKFLSETCCEHLESRILQYSVYFSYLFVDNLSEKRKKRKRISYTYRRKRARYCY